MKKKHLYKLEMVIERDTPFETEDKNHIRYRLRTNGVFTTKQADNEKVRKVKIRKYDETE